MSKPLPADLSLRPIVAADLPAIFAWQADPEACRMAVSNPRDRPTFDQHWQRVLVDPTVRGRSIVVGDQLVGTVSCFERDGKAFVGYWIDRAWWGRGIASRALALLLAEEPRRPLFAMAARSNTASVHVLQRCGFVWLRDEWTEATERFPACTEAFFELR